MRFVYGAFGNGSMYRLYKAARKRYRTIGRNGHCRNPKVLDYLSNTVYLAGKGQAYADKQKLFKGRPVKIDYDNSIYEYEYEMAEPITFETNGTDGICYGTSAEPNFNGLPTSLRKLTQSKLRFRSILTGIRVNSQ